MLESLAHAGCELCESIPRNHFLASVFAEAFLHVEEILRLRECLRRWYIVTARIDPMHDVCANLHVVYKTLGCATEPMDLARW